MKNRDIVHKFLDMLLFNIELGIEGDEIAIKFLNYFELKKYASVLKNEYKLDDRSWIFYENELESYDGNIVMNHLSKYGDLNQISICRVNKSLCFYKQHYSQNYGNSLRYIQYSENIFDEVEIEKEHCKCIYKYRHIFTYT